MKTRGYIIATISIFAVILSFTMADFFSSMTKVDYVDGSKTLKFTTKVTTAHISEAIKINANTVGFEAEVKKYINRNISVYVNGSESSLTFTGSQVNGDAVWVHYEARGVDNINTLKIKNTILFETFPRQFNVVNVAYKGQQKTMNYTKGKETNEVSF